LDGGGVICDLHAMADKRDTDYSEKLIDEDVPLGAVATVVGRIVEFDRGHRVQRDLIAQNKVHVLGGDTVERGLVHLSVGDFAEIADADFN